MLRFFRRRAKATGAISADQAQAIIEHALRDRRLTPRQRHFLRSLAAQCAPKITSSVLSEHQHQKMHTTARTRGSALPDRRRELRPGGQG
jgi:hypothetical protein